MLDTIRMIHDIILPVDASYVLDEGFDFWLGGVLPQELVKREGGGTIEDPFMGCEESKLAV